MSKANDAECLNPAFFKALHKIESTYEDDDDDDDVEEVHDDYDSTSNSNNNNNKINEIGNVNKCLASSCVITLCKILDNIILERKYNAKTRSIKLSNKLFKDKVGKVIGGGE